MEQFESEERFRAVVDAAPEIICTVTPDGRFTWFGVFPDRQPSEAVVRLVRSPGLLPTIPSGGGRASP